MLIHLGLDSTDSPSGGCTTYTASKIIDVLQQNDKNIHFIGYPKLVRLNPNIPIKTRGNAAISFSFETNLDPKIVFEFAKKIVIMDKEANTGEPHKKPGLVLKIGESLSNDIYLRGLQEVLTLDDFDISNLVDYYYPKDANGLIGAMSALYSDFSEDCTFELITYRKSESLGTKRRIDMESLILADSLFKSAFSSIDHDAKRELIAPSGPDPVFCGIRANNTNELLQFIRTLDMQEELDSWTIFQSNQATNAHVNDNVSKIDPYNVFSSELVIVDQSVEFQGGHVKLFVQTNNRHIECMAFEPTKRLRDIARLLIPGDKIYAHGNVKQNKFGTSISLEFFMITNLAKEIIISSPRCSCETTMKSAGKYKGYKCPQCKEITMVPDHFEKERSSQLFMGQRVYASLSAQRHLTRPKNRLHKINYNLRDDTMSYLDIRQKF